MIQLQIITISLRAITNRIIITIITGYKQRHTMNVHCTHIQLIQTHAE